MCMHGNYTFWVVLSVVHCTCSSSELTGTETDSQETVAGMDSDGSGGVQHKRRRLGKVFRDPVHGHIELHPLLVKIIDTPQFQRLRNIKQLGGKYHVYPGACHNRFEHSIGVAHLAGELVEMLNKQQPKLEITEDDVLCVMVAGLCHDLGHGPFSHVFDGYFIKEARRKNPDTVRKEWTHEVASVEMFDHLLKENGLELSEPLFQDERNRAFIKEMITGKPVPLDHETAQPSGHVWGYYGREEKMSFLYEIISNKETGIDVDKWDYFERDCYYMGINSNFDMRRTMKLARVIEVPEDKRRHICIRDKEAFNLYQMFHTRFSLHKRAILHPTANGIELMIRDALIAADEHLEIPGKPNEDGDRVLCRMSQAIDDMHAYTLLTDCVVQQILVSTHKDLKQAQRLLHRIQIRDLYKCAVNEVWEVKGKSVPDKEEISKEIVKMQRVNEFEFELREDDIVVDVVTFNYGMKSQNPIDSVWFYTKEDPDFPRRKKREAISTLLPDTFQEQYIRVYCKEEDKEPAVKTCFERWYKEQTSSQETPLRSSSEPITIAEKNKARRKLKL